MTPHSPPGYGASASSRREWSRLARPSQPLADRMPDPAATPARGQTVPPREARATRPKPRPREALALPGETRPHIRRLRNQIAPKVPCHLPPKITNDSGDPVIRGLH